MANIEKLENLARVVRDVPGENFNMATWKCGTIACALGHAAMDPWHIERGLSLENTSLSGQREIPICGLCSGYQAACIFYEITIDESEVIFAPDQYIFARVDAEAKAECLRIIQACIASHQANLGPEWTKRFERT